MGVELSILGIRYINEEEIYRQENRQKETEKSQNTYRENEKELYIPDNKIINLNILSDNINYILHNDKICNYYHNTMLYLHN